jgi:hypothetical protein
VVVHVLRQQAIYMRRSEEFRVLFARGSWGVQDSGYFYPRLCQASAMSCAIRLAEEAVWWGQEAKVILEQADHPAEIVWQTPV